MKRIIPFLFLSVFLLASCHKEKVTLKIQLKPGDRHLTKMSVTTEAMGQTMEMYFEIEDEVIAVDEEGKHEMNFYYRQMKMDMNGMYYDTDDPTGSSFARAMDEQMRVFMNRPLKGFVSPNGLTKVTEDFSTWPEYYKMKPEIIASMEEAFSQQNVKYPEGEIQEGDSWKADVKRKSNGMLMKLEMTYTLESVTAEAITISLDGNIESLKGQSIGGNVEGQLILDGETHYNQYMKMTMNLSTMGMSVPVVVEMEVEKLK